MSDIYANKNFPGSKPFKVSNDYPGVKDVDPEIFVLTADGLTERQRRSAWAVIENYISTQQGRFMGYQANQCLNYSDTLAKFLDSHINNIGDPFQSGNFTVNSKFIERAVLDYFASLWNAKWPHQEKTDPDMWNDWKESYWGYVLSMGSSEGNIYALWNARDYLSGKFLLKDSEKTKKLAKSSLDGMIHSAAPRYKSFSAEAAADNKYAYTPIAFYSENTHYSIVKNMRILGITTFFEEAEKQGYKCPLERSDYPRGYSDKYISDKGWPYEAPSNSDGSINIHCLEKLVSFFAEKGYPPMLIFNYGSTFKGVLDNVKEAVEKLVPVLKRYNLYERVVEYGKDERGNPLTDIRTGFWVHVDGALGAGYMPYLEESTHNYPVFDFRIKELHSITMSGHKWIGAPWPCGIYMSKGKYQLLPVDNPAYIGSSDSTFSGSRNGFSALILWDFISRNSLGDLKQRAKNAVDLAQYFINSFESVKSYHRSKDLWLEYSPNAITVRFKKVNDELIYKYSLSSESVYVGEEQLSYSHIFFMEHVTQRMINSFIEDLKSPDAFPVQNIDKLEQGDAAEPEELIMGLGLGFK